MAITITSQIQSKIQEYKDYCISAINFYNNHDYDHCTHDLRKSCEAIFKILIFEKFGDENGLKIILGEIDCQLLPKGDKHLGFSDLWTAAKSSAKFEPKLVSAYIEIKKYGDNSSHNPNSTSQKVLRIEAELCVGLSNNISKWLYIQLLSSSVPLFINEAYNGGEITSKCQIINSQEWNNLYMSVDEFSRHNKYILIAPPVFEGCSDTELKTLSRINWSFILDFNPNSKTTGLYKSLEDQFKDKIIPITIEQMGQKNIVGEGNFKVNWFFANGLTSIANSVTTDYKTWRGKKYYKFIKELLSDFFSKSVQRYTIIYLYNKIDYINEIARIISELNEDQSDLLQHVFVYQNSDILPRIQEFENYGIKIETSCLNLNDFFAGISTSILTNRELSKSIIVPARTASDDQTKKDISSIYSTLLDNHIEIVHQQIDYSISETDKDIPDFYKGQKISWKDIANDIDVRRNKANVIIEKVKHLLATSKSSVKYELRHYPGAGGTTLGRRIAFEIRNEYPTIMVSKHNRTVTHKLISDLQDTVQKSILAIVEASHINNNELEDLIRKCNSEKKTVIFLYIIRTFNKIKDSDLTSVVNATMLDIEERNRFISKFRTLATNKVAMDIFNNKQPAECELIDFSLTLDIEEYNENHILDYISGYLSKISEHQVIFIKFVAIIYYYSQRSVSELIFRNLFLKSLSDELKQTANENQYIRKILLQELDINNEHTEYWRPRYSKFAEMILKVMIGQNWKDHISIHVIELIKKCKENNPYLIEEIRKILKGVFLERNNEDLLGADEQWKGITSNDQFSTLLKDLVEKDKQKEVLQALVENYPEESHFLGHYARFLYEKADEINDYDEAEVYINRAFDCGGESDSNLQHIAGMCQRRIIEYYKRNYIIKGLNVNDLLLELVDLTDAANMYFNTSREIDPYNIHAYIAQIQTLIRVIDFGKELSGITKKEAFITNPEYSWFTEQFSTVIQLIDEAKIVIEQLETNGKTNSIVKANTYVKQSEANTFELLGDYSNSILTFKTLSDTADRNLRPYFRAMYIYSILLKKVKGIKSEINNGWSQLNKGEIIDVENALNSNILQDSRNVQSLRLWLRFVRYSPKTISLDEILTKLKVWFDNSLDNYIANLECAYYLYIINAGLAIRAGETFNDFNVKEAQRFIAICKEKSNNNKFSFEWYGIGEGIKMLINHKDHIFDDFSCLQKVKGTVVTISSKQQGKIKLDCGLDAFFVPNVGNFIQNKDETTDVVFNIGFRHDGLIAWNVKRIEEQIEVDINKAVIKKSMIEEFKEFKELNKIEEIEEIEEIVTSNVVDELYITEIPKFEGPKIVGQIDLTQFERYKKKR